jgi:hypothetical protein
VISETIACRVAENEHAFRKANERIRHASDEIAADIDPLPFICECSLRTCVETTRLSRADYLRVRADDRTFLVVRGHEVTHVEGVEVARVRESFDRFSILEKVGEAGRRAEELAGDREPAH